MDKIPSVADLEKYIKMVEIGVTGDYIARIDEKRKTTKKFSIQVLVPENFTRSDVKRQTALALQKSEKHEDFIMMRTHEYDGKAPKKSEVKKKRKEMFTERDLARFTRLRSEKKAKADEGDDDGSLPPFADEEVA